MSDPVPSPSQYHPGVLLARIRESLEPSLSSLGFQLDGRNKPDPAQHEPPAHLYIDYLRDGELLRLSWDRRGSSRFMGFIAEWIAADTAAKVAMVDLRAVSELPQHEMLASIDAGIDSFVMTIRGFLAKLQQAAARGRG